MVNGVGTIPADAATYTLTVWQWCVNCNLSEEVTGIAPTLLTTTINHTLADVTLMSFDDTYFCIQAVDASGVSSPVNWTACYLDEYVSPLAIPTGVVGVTNSGTNVDVTWDTDVAATSYMLMVWQGCVGCTPIDQVTGIAPTVGTTTTNYTMADPTLMASYDIYFCVHAADAPRC